MSGPMPESLNDPAIAWKLQPVFFRYLPACSVISYSGNAMVYNGRAQVKLMKWSLRNVSSKNRRHSSEIEIYSRP
jgi:hypothetical protein